MKKLLFMLGKHPSQPAAGDLVMTKLTMDLARESFSVKAVALTPDSVDKCSRDVVALPKPNVDFLRLVLKSLRGNRSLIHARFDTPDLRRFLETHSADRYVAEHSYMAESYMAIAGESAREKLVTNTHVPESLVLRGAQGVLAMPEVLRTRRDEIRVAKASRAVGSFDASEARAYSEIGVSKSIYLNLTLPPRKKGNVADSRQSLVFMGDLSWAPNRGALAAVLDSWTRIRASVPAAELTLIGKGSEEYASKGVPGLRALGFVPDLDEELSKSRAMIAPITVGGGVRVKLLEAAAIGLPVIGTEDAIGSLCSFLPLHSSPSSDQLVDRAILLLQDAKLAANEGAALYEANEQLWATKQPHEKVAMWLE